MDFLHSEFFTEVRTEIAPVDLNLMIPRLLAAVMVGLLLAARPWRLLMKKPLPRREMIQAQMLLCTAAAVVSAVIGNSVAHAFGLVGLGGFVRFRTGLKDPRDAAILFLMIGLGMACGRGNLGVAMVGSIFLAFLLLAVDLFGGAEAVSGNEVGPRKAVGEPNLNREDLA